jgi:hypothetical protein
VRNIPSVEEDYEVINDVIELLSKGDNNTLLPFVNESLKNYEIHKGKAEKMKKSGEGEEKRRRLLQ